MQGIHTNQMAPNENKQEVTYEESDESINANKNKQQEAEDSKIMRMQNEKDEEELKNLKHLIKN